MTRPLHRFASGALLLALPALGQDAPRPPAKQSQGSPLVIRTSDPKVAARTARGLGCEGEIPEAKDGSCWEISLDDGGKAKVTTGSGRVGYMEIVARPGPLLEIFADQADEAMAGVRAALVLAFTAQGLKAKDSARMAQGFVDFPKQIAAIEVKLSGNPDRVVQQGLDVNVEVAPVAGTVFADFIASSKPNGKGAPELAGNGMMTMSISVDSGEFGKLAKPMLEFAATFSGKTGEEAKKFLGEMSRALAWVDGSMALSWGAEGMKIVAGLSDPKSYSEFMESEAGKALMRSGSAQFDVEVQSKALEHHGVSVTRSTLKTKDDVDLPPNPVFGKGPVQTYIAVTGNWLVMSMLDTKDEGIKKLIDLAVDQKIKRTPLVNDALMTMSVDIAKMAETFAGEQVPQDAPRQMTLSIKKAGAGLGLAIHLK